MSKQQTRRAVSLAGITHARIRSVETNISGYLERLIKTDLDARGVPVPGEPLPRAKVETVDDLPPASIWSF